MPTNKPKFQLRLTSICIVVTTLALMGVGLAAIDVTQKAGGMTGLVARQMIYSLAAAVAFVGLSLIHI